MQAAKQRRGSLAASSLSQQQQHADEQAEKRDLDRRAREREKMQRDEAKKSEYMEKQKLLNQLEAPLVSLLDRLGVREELSLALAQHSVFTLKALRGCDHELMANQLLKDNLPVMREREPEWMRDTLAQAVDMARRDLAIAAINTLMLPDDYAYQQQARETMAAQEKASRSGSDDMGSRSWMSQKTAVREEDIAGLRNKDGALRKALLAVTERWQDFMASQPAFAARLSEAETGPSWKDTVSWSLWLLTRPLHDSERSRGPPTFMTKAGIEQCLQYARDYVYFALYPQMKNKSPGEWRLYWVRVFTNFSAFYSEKGRQRWMDVAACAARATALRQGKTPAEQAAAEVKAVRNVCAMLHSHHARKAKEPTLPAPLRATPRTSTVRGSGHLITHCGSGGAGGAGSSSSRSQPGRQQGRGGRGGGGSASGTTSGASCKERATSAPPERHMMPRAASMPSGLGSGRPPSVPSGRGERACAAAPSAASSATASPPSQRRGGGSDRSAAASPAAAPVPQREKGGGTSRRSRSPAPVRAASPVPSERSPRAPRRGSSPRT